MMLAVMSFHCVLTVNWHLHKLIALSVVSWFRVANHAMGMLLTGGIVCHACLDCQCKPVRSLHMNLVKDCHCSPSSNLCAEPHLL